MFAWSIWSLHFGTNLIRQNNSNESLLKTYAITQVRLSFRQLYAFSQNFLPDSILLETPLGRIKYTHVPFLAVLSVSVFSLAGVMSSVVVLQCVLAVQISWTYLRFFNPHEMDSIYGDSSDHFVWASLFPRIIQPFCTVLGRICFRILVKLGVCKR
ncbi:unnamed protein product, partial [Strongylus vulgaris]